MRRVTCFFLAAACALPPAAGAATQDIRFTASDGVSLQATVTNAGALAPRPVIVEFSPYGRGSGTFDGGGDYNHLLVQIRGTGDSDGRFDALGPRTQADVAEVLAWACHQPWSDGRLGLNGFSASAITIYNSLHRALPCVKTAVLKSGTHELYRDLLYPGAINNILPGAGVITLIGAPALAQGTDRMARNPASALDVLSGLFESGVNDLLHPTLDAWWRERGMRGDVNHLPTLMVDGIFDVESRGAFQGYQALRDDGAHLVVVGAHDAPPTNAGTLATKAWLDHYLRGVDNGVEAAPRVQLWLADGDREDYVGGRYVRVDADDWPVPGTRWVPLVLDGERLSSAAPAVKTTRAYAALPSLPTTTDPPNTAIVGGTGLDALFTGFPPLTEMTLAEPVALTYTTAPLGADVLSAGPGSVELDLASTAAQTNIWTVVSDVSPDGVAHPLMAGRLNSDFPRIDAERSLRRGGEIVQPYGVYERRTPAKAGAFRRYRVELWPLGNRFKKGHRIRLTIVGSSAASLPGAPAVNRVRDGSRLLLPVLPGSNLRAALR